MSNTGGQDKKFADLSWKKHSFNFIFKMKYLARPLGFTAEQHWKGREFQFRETFVMQILINKSTVFSIICNKYFLVLTYNHSPNIWDKL